MSAVRHLIAVTALAKLRSTAPRSAAPLRYAASAAPAASGRSCPSSLNTTRRPGTLGFLPRVGVHPLRACTRLIQQARSGGAPARLPLRSTHAAPIPVSPRKSTLRGTRIVAAHGAIGGP